MRKKIAVLLLTVVAALSLTACGKFTCDMCGEEKSGKSYKTTVFGEDVIMCKDCHDDLEELGNMFK